MLRVQAVNEGKRKWVSRRGDVELLRGSHFFFQCLYFEPMLVGAKVMDVVLWARGKSLLLAKDVGLVHLPLLDKLRIRSSNYAWQFFSQSSVIYCRVFLQPELQRFLYVGSSSQSLGSRGRTRWGKYKQIFSGKAACGELCLWWHKRKCNLHVPAPLVFMQVVQASCLRTMEQTFISLLTLELNAPWVRCLVKSKHSHGTRTDPVRAVRRQLASWRQFRRYRRRALGLTQVQPSVFRSQKVVTAIIYVCSSVDVRFGF